MTDLFQRWLQKYEAEGLKAAKITKDGIVDHDLFDRAKTRILYILKESNDFPEGDLRSLVKSGYGSQTWLNLGRWTFGVLNDFADFNPLTREETLAWNHRAAFINLKKYTGKATAYSSTINAFAYRDRELLREQIRQIQPNLIVACGVFDTVVWLLNLRIIFANEEIVQEGYCDELGCRVVAQRHPSRANPEETYNDFRERVNWRGASK